MKASEPASEENWDPNFLEDEQHIAKALYLLQKAIALREQPGYGWPTIHACLRDAASECEAARQFYSKEAWERNAELRQRISGGSEMTYVKDGNKGALGADGSYPKEVTL